MAYTEEQLQQLVSEIANEVVHGEYPTLQLPDDLKFACNVVAKALGRGPQHGLDILSILQKRKMDAVTIGALEVFCILFVDADVSVRARMLEPKTMCYIFFAYGRHRSACAISACRWAPAPVLSHRWTAGTDAGISHDERMP